MNDFTELFLGLLIGEKIHDRREKKKAEKRERARKLEKQHLEKVTVKYTVEFDHEEDADIIDFLRWMLDPQEYVIQLVNKDVSGDDDRLLIEVFSKCAPQINQLDEVCALCLNVNEELYPDVVKRMNELTQDRQREYVARLVREDNKYQRETGIIDAGIAVRLYTDEYLQRSLHKNTD